MTAPISITVEDVDFRYSIFRKSILNKFSWQIHGGLNVLLGPNGSGKSTLLQVVAGLLKPQSGVVKAPSSSAPASPLGYLPQEVPVMRGLSVAEQVRYHLWLSGLAIRGNENYVERAISQTNLGQLRDRPAHQLSGGERRRLGIACAIVHDPKIILLDEPTAGLDPLERKAVELVITEELKNRTVLVTTHQMETVVERSAWVAILNSGKLIEYQPTDWFMQQDFSQTGDPWLSVYRHYFDLPAS